MKFLLPCPVCHQLQAPPLHARSLARLRCAHCGHELSAAEIVRDASLLDRAWEVLEDRGGDDLGLAGVPGFAEPHSHVDMHVSREEDVYGVADEPWFQADVVEAPASPVADDAAARGGGEFEDLAGLAVAASGEPDTFDELAAIEGKPGMEAGEVASRVEPTAYGQDAWLASGGEETSPSLDSQDALGGWSTSVAPVDDPASVIDEEMEVEAEVPWLLEESQELFAAVEGGTPAIDDDLHSDFGEELEQAGEASSSPAWEGEDVDGGEGLSSEDTSLVVAAEEEGSTTQTAAASAAAIGGTAVAATAADSNRIKNKRVVNAEVLFEDKTRRAGRKKGSPLGTLLSVIGGGLAAIPISILLMWYALGKDPLEAGPVVTQFAPWLVPEAFRGQLPSFGKLSHPGQSATRVEAQGMPESATVLTEDRSFEVAKEPPPQIPTIASTDLSQLRTKDFTPEQAEAILDSGLFKVDQPLEAPPPETPKVEEVPQPLSEQPVPLNEKAAPGMPASPGVQSLAGEPSSEATLANAPSSTDSSTTKPAAVASPNDETMRGGLNRLEQAFAAFDPTVAGTKVELLAALRAFGELLAKIPLGDPRHAAWKVQADPLLQSVVNENAMLASFLESESQSQASTGAGPGWIGVDFVKFASSQADAEHQSWNVSKRFCQGLNRYPIQVPNLLEVQGEPDAGYLILGVLEGDATGSATVFRVLSTARRR
jgi:hypothetical protein